MNLTNVKARQSYQFRYHLNAFKMWQTGKLSPWLLILLRCFNSNCHINASLRCCQSACHPASWNCEQRDARWGFGEKATECICTSRFVFHLHIMYAHQHWINVHYEVISVFMKGHEICWCSPSVFKALLMQIYFDFFKQIEQITRCTTQVLQAHELFVHVWQISDKSLCKSHIKHATHCAGLTTTNTLQHCTCVRRINRKLLVIFKNLFNQENPTEIKNWPRWQQRVSRSYKNPPGFRVLI